jgi:hypothetical protein
MRGNFRPWTVRSMSNSIQTVAEPAGERIPDAGSDEAPLEHPPRAPMVLRVGVVGHRPDPRKRPDTDVAALRDTCHKLLNRIQNIFVEISGAHRDLFAERPARPDRKPCGLRLISSLAEGADQWVASEAERLGYELQVVLPFARLEYEKDFHDPKVRAEHRRLRDRATAVFELDGCRDRAADSYLAAGRVLLNQTDLLIAIWDHKDEQGVGGTGQIVREARQRGIPIFWVNWEAPIDWQVLNPASRPQHAGDANEAALLKEELAELLLPPTTKRIDDKPDLREAYFLDRRRSWTPLGGWWSFFRGLLVLQPKSLRIRVPEFVPATRAGWLEDWLGKPTGTNREHKLPDSTISWVEKSYLKHYAWANQLSIYCADHYRSSFAWIYLLGALAVMLALIGTTVHASHAWELIFISAEVVVICAIIGLTWYGRRRRWHERWIDYRTLAERLRLVRFNCLLGGVWQQVNVPSHLATYGNPAATWMHWHSRAVERAAGLPNIAIDREYLFACRELLLEALLAGQVKYHEDNSDRLESVDHRLHLMGAGLFLATLGACAFHLFVASAHWGEDWDRWLIFFAAFLPALGAAMAAIRSQGEFHRVVERSRAMREELGKISKAVHGVTPEATRLDSQALQQFVEQTTRLMYSEVLDWRIVFQDRPLVWPA